MNNNNVQNLDFNDGKAVNLKRIVRPFLYFLRWQFAGMLIYPVSLWLIENKTVAVLFGNTWGCFLFYFIDRWLTKKSV